MVTGYKDIGFKTSLAATTVWPYPRERKRIDVLNGIWDPMDDQTFSKSLWTPTHRSSAYSQWDILAAPGGVGGYALWMKGEVQDNIDMRGVTGVSSFRPEGYLYSVPVLGQYRWKNVIEFRLRIVSDQGSPLAGHECSHSAGFAYDGNVIWPNPSGTIKSHQARGCVLFNVANQKAGLTYCNSDGTTVTDMAKTSSFVGWPGNYNQWYDIRIEYEWNIFTTNWNYPIKVYVDNQLIIDTTIYFADWRTESGAYEGFSAMLGRPGPQIINENDDTVNVTNGTFVEAYWKDILISNEFKLLTWEYKDAVFPLIDDIFITGTARCDYPELVAKGSDIQIWRRHATTDPWKCQFRGILRATSNPRGNITVFEGDGYPSFLAGEKTDSLTFTTQTAGTIIAGAINDPYTKHEFDVSTYFESTSATYSRTYRQAPKRDIIREMMSLEGFQVFLDHGNNWHFESYRTNELDFELIWGQSKIYESDIEEIFLSPPNVLRVYGSGVMAERELAVHQFDSGAQSVKAISRLDLTTQAEVDAALEGYADIYRESIRTVGIKLSRNYKIEKGHLISLTIAAKGLNKVQFLVISIAASSGGFMELELLEAKPGVQLLLSDLTKRTDSKESEMYPEDTHDPTKFTLEGLVNVFIGCEYEIIYDSNVVRSGHAQVTKGCIDQLIDLWYDDTQQQIDYLGHGTGTTLETFNDTALETQTARPALSYVRVGKMFAYETGYRATITVVNPSSMSEIGLFRLASGGTMFARATFAPYTQTGSVTIRMTMRVWPDLGSNYFSGYAIERILYRWSTTGGIFNEPDHLRLFGTTTFHPPNVNLDRESEGAVTMTAAWAPNSAGTASRLKLYDRNMLKIKHTGTFEASINDVKIVGVTMRDGVTYHNYFMVTVRRDKSFNDLESKPFEMVVYLKFTPGTTNKDLFMA